MPRSLLSICALLGVLLLSPAASAADSYIDALELSQDWRGHVGETIAISGCTLVSATPDQMVCLAKSKYGHPPSFLVDPSGMTPGDLARAVADCSYYVGYRECRVWLEGEVASAEGELKIMGASVRWNYPQSPAH